MTAARGSAPERAGAVLALAALAVGAFGIGTTQFSPMGLLPVIASGLHVSIPRAGLLVSAYAIGVMVGAPIMTLAFARLGKRTALIAPQCLRWLARCRLRPGRPDGGSPMVRVWQVVP